MKKIICILAITISFLSITKNYALDKKDHCIFLMIADNKTKKLIKQIFKSNPTDLEKYDFLQGHSRELIFINKDVTKEKATKISKLIEFVSNRYKNKPQLILPISISSCSLIPDETNANAIVCLFSHLPSTFLADFKRTLEDVNYSYRIQFGEDPEEKLAKENDIKTHLYPNAKPMSKVDIKKYIRYASTAATAYKNDLSWMDVFDLKLIKPIEVDIPEIDYLKKDFSFFNEKTGLKAILTTNDNEIIVTFGAFGSAFPEMGADKYKSIAGYLKKTITHNIYFGSIPPYFDEADTFIKHLKIHFEKSNKKLILVGQCLGGSIAQYVGIINNIPTITFNAIPVGSGVIKKLEKFAKDSTILNQKANKLIKQIYVDTNPLIGNQSSKTYGIEYIIPSAYDNSTDSHKFVIGSIMQYIGYSKKGHTQDIDNKDVIK